LGEVVELSEGEAGGDAGPSPVTGACSPLRRGIRRAVEATVRLRCEGRVGIHTGFVRDLSRGGMFLRIVDPEPPGRRLAFELSLPGVRFPVRGLAEVAWQRQGYEGPGRPSGMALRFLALEGPAMAALAALLPEGETFDVARLEREAPSIALAVRSLAAAGEEVAGVAAEPHEPPFAVEPLFDLEPLFELAPKAGTEGEAAARPVQIVPSRRSRASDRRRRARHAAAGEPAEGGVEQLGVALAPPVPMPVYA
jgi:uncharacterized protein (TIGR02266 family)